MHAVAVELGRKIVARENRGIVLDLVVFCVNLVLARALISVALKVLHAAQEDVLAKFAIAFFFVGLVLIQPAGPLLKRWSFQQRNRFDSDSGAGCLLFWFMFVYLVLMMVLTATAVVLLGETFFKGSGGEGVSILMAFAGFAWSIASVVVVYRYFVRPKGPPRWTFLTTRTAERLGDACTYLNVIGLQILWGTVIASALFREAVTGSPLGRPGSFTDIVGRFVVIAVLAALVYVPGRIFYLVEDKHRALTWATMVLANLPLILWVAFAPPFRT